MAEPFSKVIVGVSIAIKPHERFEAVAAYRDRLSPEQMAEVVNAPEGAIVQLRISIAGTQVVVIEEG